MDGLPSYDEIVMTVNMGSHQQKEYSILENTLRMAVKEYRMRATSLMLQSLLSYPDSCVVFPEYVEIREKDKDTGRILVLETAWANFRKKEIETNLAIVKKETIFTEKGIKGISKSKPMINQVTVSQNTVINVTIMEGKKKKVSRLSVKYGDLESELKGKVAQFALLLIHRRFF